MQKNEIKGINISSELVLLNISGFDDFFLLIQPFFQMLKKKRINTPFLSASFGLHRKAGVSCCFSPKDIDQIKSYFQKNECLEGNSRFVHNIGLLSVFPHRSCLNLLGMALSALEGANLPILGLASSISSLVFVLEYNQLGRAMERLKGCFLAAEGIN